MTIVGFLLFGWLAVNTGPIVEAHERHPTVEREIADAVREAGRKILGANCTFVITDTGRGRGVILLNQKTGESWWYDNGWDGRRYNREPEWREITR